MYIVRARHLKWHFKWFDVLLFSSFTFSLSLSASLALCVSVSVCVCASSAKIVSLHTKNRINEQAQNCRFAYTLTIYIIQLPLCVQCNARMHVSVFAVNDNSIIYIAHIYAHCASFTIERKQIHFNAKLKQFFIWAISLHTHTRTHLAFFICFVFNFIIHMINWNSKYGRVHAQHTHRTEWIWASRSHDSNQRHIMRFHSIYVWL